MDSLGIELDFFEPEDKYGPIKATVHRSGRLGFSSGANQLINFEENRYFKIGKKQDGDDERHGLTLYMVPVNEKDEKTFEVLKAGAYFYLKTKRLLNQLNI